MKTDPRKKNSNKENQRTRKQRWKRIVSTLAAITVFCTTYALILPAITVNSDTYCGFEEHEHTEDCYELELICALTEGEQEEEQETEPAPAPSAEEAPATVIEIQEVLVDEGHVHQDSCYEETKTLVCGLEETEEVLGMEEPGRRRVGKGS